MKIELDRSVASELFRALAVALDMPLPVGVAVPFKPVEHQPAPYQPDNEKAFKIKDAGTLSFFPIEPETAPAQEPAKAEPLEPAMAALPEWKFELKEPAKAQPMSDFLTSQEPVKAAPPANLATINDKQWSAILNAGISHGMSIDKVSKSICEFFKVGAIKELLQSNFQAALDLVSGKSITTAVVENPSNSFQKEAENTKISMKQWSQLLNAGCYVGIGVDNTEAFIKEKFGCRARDLKVSQYDEALEAIRALDVPTQV